MMAGDPVGEAKDPDGVRVIVPTALWQGKILRDHPELASHLADLLNPIAFCPIRSTMAVAATTCAEPVLVVGCWWS